MTARRTAILPIAPAALIALAGLAAALALRAPDRRSAGEPQSASPAPIAAPALTPAQELATFALADPALRIDLIASEPTVIAPVVISFDEDGRLWVVEMQSYMPNMQGEGENIPTSRIIILDDRDEDGSYESSTVFLDGLILPRAILPCYGGALILEPPNLYFCKDHDGDGRADEKRKLLDGLAGENPEHAPNGLLWGLDNWIHLSQCGRELRFDGDKVVTRPTPAHGQWGLTADDAGRLYYTPNSNALQGDLFPKHYAARNPDQRNIPGINHEICRDQVVWPARPTTGVNRGYLEGILRPDGRLRVHTAACGTTIYRDDRLAPEYSGNAFVCEPAGLLVRRLILEEHDGVPVARAAYPDRDFLTSTDERFRPVWAAAGPEGALYIADMYRGVIQHKTYLTPYLKEQIKARGLETPLEMGRIWRIAPADAPSRGNTRMSELSNEALVELLADRPRAHHARRLLIERRATEVADELRSALDNDDPAIRLQAYWTMEGLGLLALDDALTATRDANPLLRRDGARLCELFRDELVVWERLDQLLQDPDRTVRIQAALSLTECPREAVDIELARACANAGDDPILRAALVSGVDEVDVLEGLLQLDLSGPDWPRTSSDRGLLAELADCAARSSGSCRLLLELATQLAEEGDRRAGLILNRVRAAQRLDSDAPSTLTLDMEPRGFIPLGEEAGADIARSAADIAWYLDWPGRPPVEPPRRARPLNPAERTAFERGRQLFAFCATCHGHDGRGIIGQVPPIAGSPYVLGPESTLAKILLHGLEGEITIEGAVYNSQMPPAPFRSDDDIAAILTYIRRSWDNTADPVSPETVRKARAQTATRRRPWTQPELDALPR